MKRVCDSAQVQPVLQKRSLTALAREHPPPLFIPATSVALSTCSIVWLGLEMPPTSWEALSYSFLICKLKIRLPPSSEGGYEG